MPSSLPPVAVTSMHFSQYLTQTSLSESTAVPRLRAHQGCFAVRVPRPHRRSRYRDLS